METTILYDKMYNCYSHYFCVIYLVKVVLFVPFFISSFGLRTRDTGKIRSGSRTLNKRNTQPRQPRVGVKCPTRKSTAKGAGCRVVLASAVYSRRPPTPSFPRVLISTTAIATEAERESLLSPLRAAVREQVNHVLDKD